VWDGVPASGGHCSQRVQPHFSVHDLAEQARSILCADRHEIRPWLGIITSLQADGAAMVFVRIVCHGSMLGSSPHRFKRGSVEKRMPLLRHLPKCSRMYRKASRGCNSVEDGPARTQNTSGALLSALSHTSSLLRVHTTRQTLFSARVTNS
jgi:hypothetical protein